MKYLATCILFFGLMNIANAQSEDLKIGDKVSDFSGISHTSDSIR